MDSASQHLFSHKIKSAKQISELIGERPRAKKVIMCHGTFDVVHPGHVRHLLYAKTKADILIASLTADVHIEKANMRPYVPQALRAMNLAALEMVDYVVIDEDPTPLKNLALVQPDYFAKGYEYTAGATSSKTQAEIDTLDSFGGEIIFTPGDIIYSSTALLALAPPAIAVEKLITLMEAEGISFKDLRDSLQKIKSLRVHVVGDTIVDSYTHCSMIGGLSKTPTLSVRLDKKVDYVGGAGVVAKHLHAAGAEVTLSTVLGNDVLKNFVINDLNAYGVNCLAILDPTRPTTNKNAIVAQTYRLLKIDTLDNRSISAKILKKLKKQLTETETQAVIFSDFRHGIFNRSTITELTAAIPKGVFRVADSQVASRWGNILDFQNFDLITPNEREARFALGDQDSVIRPLARDLLGRSNCNTLILKCGERGIITYRSGEMSDPRAFFNIESFASPVVDAVGAGDALLAYATLVLVVTKNPVIASILGNIAAGVECELEGNMPVTPALILNKLNSIEKQLNYE